MRQIAALIGIAVAQGGVAIGRWGVYAYHGYIQRIGYAYPYFWFLSREGVCLLDSETGAYRELDKTQGLLYNRPTALYSDARGEIFLGYEDGHIQYGSSPERLAVIRDIAANPFYTSRAVRDFYAKGDTLFVATDFGIVVWHRKARQVMGTVSQFPGKPFAAPVKAVWYAAGRLWAFLDEGLYTLSEGRPWLGPWQKVSRSGVMDTFSFFRGWAETPMGLLTAYKGMLYRWADTGWTAYQLDPPLGGRRVFSLCSQGRSWAVALDTTDIFYFGADGSVRKLWNPQPHVLWISADGSLGAAGSTWIGGIAFSPRQNLSTDAYQRLRGSLPTDIAPTPEGIYFLHGGSGFWGPGWGNVITFYPHGAQKGAEIQASQILERPIFGFSQVAWDGHHAWVLTSRLILRLRGTSIVDTFSAYNAPFDGLFPDAEGRPTFMGFSAIAIDSKGTIWIGKTAGFRNILWYSPSTNRWYTLPRSEAVLSVKVDLRGYKWFLLRGGKILVVDDQGQPDEPSRLRIALLGDGGQPLPGLPSTAIQAIAPDRAGAIWLGTDKGVTVLYGDPFTGTLSVSIPVIENRYLLEEESITDIAVDGQNRKWIGTYGSGIYVLSADGTRQLASYNVSNSPLPSNLIYRIRPWDYTGEIFMLTSAGTVSYRDWTTLPSERLDTLHIFPNPVSRKFEGWVGIRGLSENSTVRIMTTDGQLVRYLQGFGGQAVWDLRTVNGEKVSPGIYLIGAIDKEGQRSALGKIIVMD
ncbi:MAG: two-component regulator propeller domain-containing protein [Bacteroidia bacterium]